MSISSINNASTYVASTLQQNKSDEVETKKPKATEEGQRPPRGPKPPVEDSYTPSSEGLASLATLTEDSETEVTAISETADTTEASGTQSSSSNYEIDRDFITALKTEQAENKIAFLMKITGMFSEQSISMASGDGIWAQIAQGNFEVSEAESAEAAEAISEDGYWGITQTSERMFEMAMSLSGGDPEVMAEMREAFERGYEAAENAWGGELPQIAQDTREATLAMFDQWEADFAG